MAKWPLLRNRRSVPWSQERSNWIKRLVDFCIVRLSWDSNWKGMILIMGLGSFLPKDFLILGPRPKVSSHAGEIKYIDLLKMMVFKLVPYCVTMAIVYWWASLKITRVLNFLLPAECSHINLLLNWIVYQWVKLPNVRFHFIWMCEESGRIWRRLIMRNCSSV